MEIGNKFAERMRRKGPYIALHLRMEKDVWVRTGCLPGLSHEHDEIISNERKLRPELLTGRSNMSFHDRKLAGLCPLNALEVTRLALKALPINFEINQLDGLKVIHLFIYIFANVLGYLKHLELQEMQGYTGQVEALLVGKKPCYL